MKALKALVIGMGVLIFAGLVVVVVTIANRSGSPKPPTAEPKGGSGTLEIPAGATVLESDLDSARVALRLRLSDGTMVLSIHDLATGKHLSTLPIAARPAPPVAPGRRP